MATKSGSGKKSKGKNKRRGRTDRRKKEEEFEAARRKKNLIKGVLAVIIIAALAALIFIDLGDEPENTEHTKDYEIIGSDIVIPLSDISKTAKFFSYNSGGTNVEFFAVIGTDGAVHTAFDACEVCFDAKKGYFQNGAEMVCRNCQQRFSTNEIGTTNQGGGCWPSYLERSIVGDNIVISISEMNRGAYLFD